MSETEIATIPISSDDWPEPIEVIELPAGYTWQMFSRWGPHFLCKDGSPIEATGKYGNTWRVTHEQGPQQELEIFARDIRSSLSKKDEEIEALSDLLTPSGLTAGQLAELIDERDTFAIRARDLESSLSSARSEIARLREALETLVNAPALEKVESIVAGWSGPPERPYSPHPANLGARIETTCGRIYALDKAIKDARSVLAQAKGDPK